MLKKNIVLWLSVTISMCASLALAGNVTLPNTFVSGEIATASGVNDNFTTLESGINDNAASIPVLKDSSGQTIGTVIGRTTTSFAYGGGPYYTVFNSNDYMFNVVVDGNLQSQGLHFEDANCTPPAYTVFPPQSVFAENNVIYYVPPGAPSTSIIVNSTSNDGVCSAGSGLTDILFAPLLNDSAVTGVSSSTFSTPLSLGTK